MPTGQVFIIPRRNDVGGMSLYVRDLFPNSSQRNLIYDVGGQTHYLRYSLDVPGTTNLAAGAFASGSLNTSPIGDASADDTTGGGNDVLATQATTYGLAGYLRERVQPGGIASAVAGRMTAANALLQAQAIQDAADAGDPLTLTAINVILEDVGVGGTADTDLDGTASKSFGSVEDILRILSGETYRSPEYTIICNVGNQFRSLAERDVLVAAQDTATTGQTFVSSGYFVTSMEPGYRKMPIVLRTGALNASLGDGFLATHKNDVTFKNPNYAYSAADVTTDRLRATALDGTAIPSTGTYPVLVVYDAEGNAL